MTVKLTQELTTQEWTAIINGLQLMSSTYVKQYSGVDLAELAQKLADKVVFAEQNTITASKAPIVYEDTTTPDPDVYDFEERFAPTEGQITFAANWAKEHNMDSVFVSVNFPGKRYGIWLNGQKREPVMDGDEPVFWTDRNVAMTALRTEKFGNTIFRVYSDGEVGAAIENI